MKIFHIYTNLLKDTGGETTAYIRNYLEDVYKRQDIQISTENGDRYSSIYPGY